jgi:hypothetical protein
VEPPAVDDRRSRILIAAVFLLAPLPYLGQLGGGFLDWDDGRFISANPLFHGPIGDYVRAALTRIQFQAYHPLHLLSYLPDRLLWPDHPTGFRVLNLLVLGTATALLFRLLCRRTGPGPALFAALAFAWHPVVTESASWITARKDLLCLLLVVGVLRVEDRAEGSRLDLRSLGLTVAAILTKSAALVLPFFIFAWHRYVRGQPLRTALMRALPPALIGVATAALVTWLWDSQQMLLPARPLPAFIDVPGTVGFYLRHLLWPARLSPLYPAVPDGFVPGALLVVGLAITAILFWGRLPPAARFAVVAFTGALLPVANLVPLYYRFADRYQLLALLALAWPVAAGSAWIWNVGQRRRSLLVAGAIGCLLLEGGAAFRLSRHWRQSSTLWVHATQAQPRSFFAFLKLGELRSREASWTEASRAYLRAIEIDPDSALGFVGLFGSSAQRQEAAGRLPAGTARQWQRRLEVAILDPSQLHQLATDTRAAGCAPCSQTVLWLSLRLFPRGDDQLLALAERALAMGLPGDALIVLQQLKDPSSPRARDLLRWVQIPAAPR